MEEYFKEIFLCGTMESQCDQFYMHCVYNNYNMIDFILKGNFIDQYDDIIYKYKDISMEIIKLMESRKFKFCLDLNVTNELIKNKRYDIIGHIYKNTHYSENLNIHLENHFQELLVNKLTDVKLFYKYIPLDSILSFRNIFEILKDEELFFDFFIYYKIIKSEIIDALNYIEDIPYYIYEYLNLRFNFDIDDLTKSKMEISFKTCSNLNLNRDSCLFFLIKQERIENNFLFLFEKFNFKNFELNLILKKNYVGYKILDFISKDNKKICSVTLNHINNLSEFTEEFMMEIFDQNSNCQLMFNLWYYICCNNMINLQKLVIKSFDTFTENAINCITNIEVYEMLIDKKILVPYNFEFFKKLNDVYLLKILKIFNKRKELCDFINSKINIYISDECCVCLETKDNCLSLCDNGFKEHLICFDCNLNTDDRCSLCRKAFF
jgi:hypothetical protein